MRKLFLILVLSFVSIYIQAQQMPLPDPNTSNVLFLKFSKNLNGINAYSWSYIKKSDGSVEKQDVYFFTNKDSKGKTIEADFYTPDKTNFAYVPPGFYPNAITEEQLKAILDNKKNLERDNYLRSFSHIYIIDLDAQSPSQSFKYKIIEVKPYFFWEHN